MKDIETLAIGLFNRFSQKKDGRTYDWNYLSKDRQIEWMKEAVIHTEFLLKNIRDRVKPVPGPSSNPASYELGFLAGQQSERMKFIQLLEYLDQDLKNQLSNIINPPDL